MDHNETDERGQRLAEFSERTLAFSIDYAVFALGYLLSLKLFFPAYPVTINPHSSLWVILWTALFLVYQAYSSSEGRVSLGKSLLGLRVINAEGEALDLGTAVIRSLTYLVSSVLSLGFLWALLSPNRQGWHDMAAGSLVISTRKRPQLTLIRAGAFASLTLFAGAWMWQNVWAPRYYRIMTVAYSHVGLERLSQLQGVYHKKNGRYADNIIGLATVSGDPMNFMRSMVALFDPKAGFEFKNTKNSFTILAKANDRYRTKVTIAGP